MPSPAAPILDAVIGWLLRWRLPVLLTLIAITLVAWPIAGRLQFDQSIESLYAEDDPHFKAWADSRRLFGGDEFALIAWREPDLFEPDGVTLSQRSRAKLKGLAGRLAEVPGVYPDSIQHPAAALDLEVVPAPLRAFFSEERRRVASMLEGVLLGADRETTAVMVRLKPERESPVTRGETIARIRELAAAQTPPAFVVGEPVQVHDMFRYVEEDGRLLFLVSLALLALVLMVLFRSLRWVLLPLLIVVITIRWTEALLVLAGAKLSMVSSMLNSLVTIIGVATATHLAVGFRDRRRTMPREAALRSAIVELTPAIFWTSATTALGFAALLSSRITPVRSFGLMMTVATMLCFLVVLLLAVTGLSRWARRADDDSFDEHRPNGAGWSDLLIGDPIPAPAERHLVSVLSGISRFTQNRPGFVTLVTLVTLLLAVTGVGRLRVETDFSRNFRDSSDIVRSLNFVEANLGGAGSWEVNFSAPAELTEDFLEQVRQLTSRLRSELQTTPSEAASPEAVHGRLTKVSSLTDALELVPKQIGIGFVSRKFSLNDRLSMLAAMQSEVVTSLYNPAGQRMRIVLRGLERQRSDRKVELIARVKQIATETMQTPVNVAEPVAASAGSETAPQATGLFVLLTFLIESLMSDQVTSFVIAAVGIGVMMSIALRSLRLGLISLVPNLFPIVVLIGTMGWLGVPINIATAMIASVSMGLTVDSSVHYLAVYTRARREGRSVDDALHQTQTQVGRALVFANAALVAGFSVLTLSHFIPLVYFGVLVSIAMLGGLTGNLFLLPLLIRLVDRSGRQPPPSTADAVVA